MTDEPNSLYRSPTIFYAMEDHHNWFFPDPTKPCSTCGGPSLSSHQKGEQPPRFACHRHPAYPADRATCHHPSSVEDGVGEWCCRCGAQLAPLRTRVRRWLCRWQR